MKALILDDSRAMRRLLGRIVNSLGFEMIEAEDGRDGLQTLRTDDDIKLVLVDWNMPGMNGLEFVETVRSQPEHQWLPMVMVTTESEPARMARALMAGVDEFVMKPFTAGILLEKLKLIGVTAAVAR
ncbi:response regulator [bacterium]|nr:response regulator [bacterium]